MGENVDPAIKEIRRHAARVRAAIEATTYKTTNMTQFPVDCCHHACHILRLYFLGMTTIGLFETVTGRKGGFEHLWLTKDGVIVDITGDQFNDGQPSVLVCRQSVWHDNWHGNPNGVVYDAECLV